MMMEEENDEPSVRDKGVINILSLRASKFK